MGNDSIHLQIITPRGIKFDMQTKSVVFRCIDGNMGVLPRHEAVSVAVGDGILYVKGEQGEVREKIAVFGGIATVKNNTLKLMTSIAQRPEEIDRERAERDKEEIVRFIEEREELKSDMEMESYQILLRRALVRIEVSTYLNNNED